MTIAKLIPFITVAPLLGALITPLIGRGILPWLIATLCSWFVFALSVMLLIHVTLHGSIEYAMGGWPAPIGIAYHIDALNAFALLIVTGVAAAVTPYSRLSVANEIPAAKHKYFYAVYLLFIAGLIGITVTGDVFNLYVLLEVSSLTSYILIAMGKDRRALSATFKYLILGTIGATFILIGIGYLYMATGTLNMLDMASRIASQQDSRTVLSAFAFIVVGASIKLALFPLHTWLPRAYTYAPTAVTALLAGTSTKVGVYILVRILFTIFGGNFSFHILPTAQALIPLACAAILYASAMAISCRDAKKMFAWSSVAQIGYIILGFSFISVTGLSAGVIHLFNHALIKTALFLALGCVIYRLGNAKIETFAGIGKTMPWTAAAILLGGLSLIGIPLTTGFVSKWYVVLAAIEQSAWWAVAAVVLGSILGLVYVWRIVEAMYFKAAVAADTKEAPFSLLLPVWILICANIYFGAHATLTAELATHTAQVLLGVAP